MSSIENEVALVAKTPEFPADVDIVTTVTWPLASVVVTTSVESVVDDAEDLGAGESDAEEVIGVNVVTTVD
jgi:hypothetical protein